MLRWGILFILLGLAIAFFFGGPVGIAGTMIDIGKWLIIVALVIYVIWLIVGGLGPPSMGGTSRGGTAPL